MSSMIVSRTLVFCSILISATASVAVAADAALRDFVRPKEIPFPADNPYTPEKAALGKALYFETRLSGAQNMNCAACHNPSFGWEAPTKTPVGAGDVSLGRQAPTILNIAWVHPLFWDGRAATAEEQAIGPIQAPAEMNLALDEAVARLKAIPAYDAWFTRVFPQDGVTGDSIAKAIATFERTVVASHAPFDEWVEGNGSAVSDAAKRGFGLFVGKAGCSGCHSGWNFTDNAFHDIGATTTDLGRGAIEKDNVLAQYAFKTPSLRDVAQRAPYLHDGSLATLRAVMDHYVVGGIQRPSLSPRMAPVALSDGEIDDIIAFMVSLTGKRQVVALPVLPN